MSETINIQQIVNAFKDSIGEGKADEFVTTAAANAGVADKQRYTEQEALEIADEISELEEVSSFVRTSAMTLKTRIRTDNL